MAGVRVVFHPQFDLQPFVPSGVTDAQGHFILSTARPGDGAPPGEYLVTFEWIQIMSDRQGMETEIDRWKGKHAQKEKALRVIIGKEGGELEPFRLE